MTRIVKDVIYQAKTRKESSGYYPVIAFYSATISDCYYLNNPCPTRSKARTIAIKYIKAIQDPL
jgi:hypothetical protein